MPDNNPKVALFIDFDNIRIGIRQHFGGELHPQKLMSKASKYGRVVTAKAYADFTGHPKEFQDRLLFAAGIEPIHAPSKISGGRRQSSADMHMVIDMFLEAIDHEDIGTFVLMTGDADFVRMVATLRRRFGRKVIISGVQSTSTSLDLMNAADGRDPITKQDCDMTGELGRMTRPLVTRADLDAQLLADEEEAARAKGGIGGIFGGIFGRKKPAAEAPRVATPAPIAPPPLPSAPRRMRATEVRGTASPGRAVTPSRAPAAPRATPAGRSVAQPAAAPSRARQPQRELPPLGPDSQPDEVERNIIREVHMMPSGRSGYSTMKTIEETLRSKAGQLGSTRKEIPTRLDRLEQMGAFKRQSRPRGTGSVETGELVADHPAVVEVTQGLTRPEPRDRPERLPRAPRAASTRVDAEEAVSAVEAPALAEGVSAEAVLAEEAPEAAEPGAAQPAQPTPAATEASGTFRWVTGGEANPTDEATAPAAEEPAAKKPRRSTTTRKAAPRTSSRTTRSKPAGDADAPAAEPEPQDGAGETEAVTASSAG